MSLLLIVLVLWAALVVLVLALCVAAARGSSYPSETVPEEVSEEMSVAVGVVSRE